VLAILCEIYVTLLKPPSTTQMLELAASFFTLK